MGKRKRSTIEKFVALPDAEKERIYNEIEAETPQKSLARSRPLNARERAQWQRFKGRRGDRDVPSKALKNKLRLASAQADRGELQDGKGVFRKLDAIIERYRRKSALKRVRS